MNLREIWGTVHVPYLKVVYAVAICGFLVLIVPNWLAPSYFFLKYIGLSILLAVALYLSFWMYKAGHKKLSLLYAIGFIALYAVSIVVFKWAYAGLYGL